MTPEQQLRETRVKLWAEVDGTNRLVETSMLAIAEAVPAVGRLLDPIPDLVPEGTIGASAAKSALLRYQAWLIGGEQ